MEMIESRNVDHKGSQFILKLYHVANGFSVIAYLGEQQVSPSYGVSFTTNADYFMQYQKKLTDHLFEIAQSDIEYDMYIRA